MNERATFRVFLIYSLIGFKRICEKRKNDNGEGRQLEKGRGWGAERRHLNNRDEKLMPSANDGLPFMKQFLASRP